MNDDERALRMIDQELDAALAGLSAPPGFAAAVRRRVAASRVSPLPEILDSIGWAAVLTIVSLLLLWFAPMLRGPWWPVFAGGIVMMPALFYGWRSIRAIAE